MRHEGPSPWWNWVGLVVASAIYVAAVLTLGLGLLLSPIGLVISVWAIRKVPRPRSRVVWVGLAANAVLVLATLYLVAAIAFGSSTG